MEQDITIRILANRNGDSVAHLDTCCEQVDVIREFARIHEFSGLLIAPFTEEDNALLFVAFKEGGKVESSELTDFNQEISDLLGVKTYSIPSERAIEYIPQLELRPYTPASSDVPVKENSAGDFFFTERINRSDSSEERGR